MCQIALIGAVVDAAAQAQQGEYDQKVAENNAKLIEYQRTDVLNRSHEAARRREIEGRRLADEQTLAIAGNGIDPTSGTAAKFIENSVGEAAADAERERSSGWRAAWGLEQQARDTREQGRMAKQAGYMSSTGTLLAGVGQYVGSRKPKPQGGGDEGGEEYEL